MKFGRELKTVRGLSDKEAIEKIAEHLIFLQRELERVLTQMQKKG